ncbi:MAG TPA: hypothetical protein VIW29_15210, partial [Polyangiaceae bacterium]
LRFAGDGVITADEEHPQQVVPYFAWKVRSRRAIGLPGESQGGLLKNLKAASIPPQLSDQLM